LHSAPAERRFRGDIDEPQSRVKEGFLGGRRKKAYEKLEGVQITGDTRIGAIVLIGWQQSNGKRRLIGGKEQRGKDDPQRRKGVPTAAPSEESKEEKKAVA